MSNKTEALRVVGKVRKIINRSVNGDTDYWGLIDAQADSLELITVLLAEANHDDEVVGEANAEAARLRNLHKEFLNKRVRNLTTAPSD